MHLYCDHCQSAQCSFKYFEQCIFDHPVFTVSKFMEIQLVFKGLNTYIIGADVLLRILEPKKSNNKKRKYIFFYLESI